MKQKGGNYEDSVINETGKYNTSKLYAELLVMQPLYLCSQLRDVCYHGTSSIVEEFVLTPQDKTKAKLHAIERYITTMLGLITNTIGQANKPESITDLEIIKFKLKINYASLSSVKIERTTQSYNGTYEWTEINNSKYNLILEEINNLYEKMSRVLTKENMIHYNIPEFDEDRAKEIFQKNFTEDG